jgi:hypothetical protein
MNIEETALEVECSADFAAEGAPASAVTYSAKITARATKAEIRALGAAVDGVAEIQNSLRAAIPVALVKVEAQTVP